MKVIIVLISCLVTTAVGQQSRPQAAQFMKLMHASMAAMDGGMAAAPVNGNVDHDSAVMMTPHHHGAIDMAKAELRYGKDPLMRRLPQEILVDQESEIDAMRLWLSNGTKEIANKRLVRPFC